MEPLLRALQVPCLSRAVQQSVVPVAGWSGSVELDPIIADCLLALQRYLMQHMPSLYQTVQDTVAPLLLNLRYSHHCLDSLLLWFVAPEGLNLGMCTRVCCLLQIPLEAVALGQVVMHLDVSMQGLLFVELNPV